VSFRGWSLKPLDHKAAMLTTTSCNSPPSLFPDYSCTGTHATTRRLNSGNACYHSVQNLLSSRLLSKNEQIRIYKTILLLVVLYECETWSLTLHFFFICIVGVDSNWVHSALRPPIGLLCQPRVIMMEKRVELLAGETEVLGENLPYCRFVHHKPRPPRWDASD
jgi:hypothetical protein